MYIGALFLSFIVFGVINWLYASGGLASAFHPFTYYSLFHGIVFVLRPAVAYFAGYDAIYQSAGFVPSLSDKLTVIGAANLGFIVFSIVCTRVGNEPMQFRDKAAQLIERKLLQRVLPLFILICAPIALYSFFIGVTGTAQGIDTMVMRNGIKVNTTSNGYLSEAAKMLVPICAMLAWFFRFRLVALVPLVLFFVLKASTGGRGAFVLALAVTALFYLYDQGRRFPNPLILFAVLPVLLVFQAVGDDRGASIRNSIGLESPGSPATTYVRDERFLEGMDFANLEFFEFVVYVVPQRSGTYDYFLSNLQLFTEPVPRVLWPGKPVGAPIQPINFLKYGYPLGFTLSMPGVGWYELGWLGVVLWCSFWGFLTGKAYSAFVRGRQSTVVVAAYMMGLASLVIVFRDGTLITLARGSIFYFTPILVLIYLKRLMKLPNLEMINDALARRRTRLALSQSQVVPTA